MTPEEWDASGNPAAMLRAALTRISARKRRLFLVAAVRDARRFHLLPAVADVCALAERVADGLADDAARQVGFDAALSPAWINSELPALLAPWDTAGAGNQSAQRVCYVLAQVDGDPARRLVWLREVVGNPFRWVRWEDEWLTPTVHTLAAEAYSAGRFDGLPILADAVEDAGCDNPELLAHLRGRGPHCRGCWALDVILGKT